MLLNDHSVIYFHTQLFKVLTIYDDISYYPVKIIIKNNISLTWAWRQLDLHLQTFQECHWDKANPLPLPAPRFTAEWKVTTRAFPHVYRPSGCLVLPHPSATPSFLTATVSSSRGGDTISGGCSISPSSDASTGRTHSPVYKSVWWPAWPLLLLSENVALLFLRLVICGPSNSFSCVISITF